jgi:hypothetical protein
MVQSQSHDEYILTESLMDQQSSRLLLFNSSVSQDKGDLPEMSLKDEQLINLCSLYSADHKDLTKVERVVSKVYASDAVWEDPLVYMRGREQVGV